MIKKIFTSKPAKIIYVISGVIWTGLEIVTLFKSDPETLSEE